MSAVTDLARMRGRAYITPEDIADLLAEGVDPTSMRLDVLEVLGEQTPYGAEDHGLCAFVAWRGTAT